MESKLVPLKQALLKCQKTLKKLASTDVTYSLAHALLEHKVHFCKPDILTAEEVSYVAEGQPCIGAVDMVNPILLMQKNHSIVPNTIALDSSSKLTLVSGPNGSGKTTFLETICLNLILSQIGCFPLASSFKFTPFQQVCLVKT